MNRSRTIRQSAGAKTAGRAASPGSKGSTSHPRKPQNTSIARPSPPSRRTDGTPPRRAPGSRRGAWERRPGTPAITRQRIGFRRRDDHHVARLEQEPRGGRSRILEPHRTPDHRVVGDDLLRRGQEDRPQLRSGGGHRRPRRSRLDDEEQRPGQGAHRRERRKAIDRRTTRGLGGQEPRTPGHGLGTWLDPTSSTMIDERRCDVPSEVIRATRTIRPITPGGRCLAVARARDAALARLRQLRRHASDDRELEPARLPDRFRRGPAPGPSRRIEPWR